MSVHDQQTGHPSGKGAMKATGVTDVVARFVSRFRLDDLSERAIMTVKLGFLDCIGVALAGTAQPAGRTTATFVRAQGTGAATVWGHDFTAPPALAALANGTAAHALDFDDVNWALIGHPSASLVAATVAAGEVAGASGAALIEAYGCGFEVLGKLGRSCMPDFSYVGGWHATGVLGAIGAAAAVSRLLALDEERSRHALGIAASEASGIVKNFGTMTKPLHAGLAAQAGVQAGGLAGVGLTADPEALEGKHGFYSCYGATSQPALEALDELGQVYELETTGLVIKPYPCGVAGHPAIDAALALRERLSAQETASIARIEVGVTSYTLDKMRYGWPANELQAKFSIPYQTARTLLSGSPSLADFSPNAIANNPSVRALAEKVELCVDEEIEAAWRRSGGSRPCRVTVDLRDGRQYEETVKISKGNPGAPLSQEELRSKFRGAACFALDDERIARLLAALEGLEELRDARELGRMLRPGREER